MLRRPRCLSCGHRTTTDLPRHVYVCPACGRVRTGEDLYDAIYRASRSRWRALRWLREAVAGLR